MPVRLDITPSEFIYKYLTVSEDNFRFVRYHDKVYLIDEMWLFDCDGGQDAVLDTYDANSFSRQFGLLTSVGLMYCLDDFADYIKSHSYSDGTFDSDIRCWFEDYLKANLPQDADLSGFRDNYTCWYANFAPDNWFDSPMLKLICEVARDGAIFADEIVPIASEDILEELDYSGVI